MGLSLRAKNSLSLILHEALENPTVLKGGKDIQDPSLEQDPTRS